MQHLVHLFAPSFNRGMILNLRHRGGKCLVVKMDKKGSRQFWLNYFFVKTEVVVTDVTDFPEAWNHTRNYSCFCFYLFKYLFTLSLSNNPSFSAAIGRPLQLVIHLTDWIRQVLHCTVGISNYPSFFQKFKLALLSTGNFHLLVDAVLVFVYIIVLTIYVFSRFR